MILISIYIAILMCIPDMAPKQLIQKLQMKDDSTHSMQVNKGNNVPESFPLLGFKLLNITSVFDFSSGDITQVAISMKICNNNFLKFAKSKCS